MKVAVRYYSKSGNTKKLANAIANEIGVEAFPITKAVDKDTDILFLGSSVYAAGIAGDVKNFIQSLDMKNGSVVNFSTAAIIESTYKQVKKLVEEKTIHMSDDEFHCRGSFTLMHKGKPDEKDLQNAKAFANKFMSKVK